MDFCKGKPRIGEKPEQLMEIEADWAKWYDGDNNCEFEIHASPWLERCINRVTDGKTGKKWFVPLCEKSPTMKWLYDHGDDVIGVELVGKAIEKFFDTYDMKYTKSAIHQLPYACLYQNDDKRVNIFKCNIFDVTKELIGGPVDAVWDRGSLQDIDHKDRPRYGEIIMSVLKPEGKILAETFEVIDGGIDQTTSPNEARGEDDRGRDTMPSSEHTPHSVNAADFKRIYGERCDIEVLAEEYWDSDHKVVDKEEPFSYINTIRLISFTPV
ncbi:probable thiopurine S-methyltransferase [Lytechinus pictus]|uniref:probable thiopurine S-methyltransferase n=1 Tax=Lytechinus pictus TaxID=7653 RepID=UPI0030B9DC2E